MTTGLTKQLNVFEDCINYDHEIIADGGFWSASLTLNMHREEAFDWLEHGLMRDISTIDASGNLAFNGFVNRITLDIGGLNNVTVGPIINVGNRVSGAYSPLDIDVYPPVTGTSTVTLIVEDEESQRKYGIIEKVLSLGTLLPDNAERARDTYLEENKEPSTSGDLSLSGAGQDLTVSLDILGYIHMLDFYVYNNYEMGFYTIAEKIIDVLDADPNGVISDNRDLIEANLDLVVKTEEDNRYAWTIIKELTKQGDINARRYLFGLTDSRVPYYKIMPDDEAEYRYEISDVGQRIIDKNGEVKPWNIRPGKWLDVSDFMIGRYGGEEFRRDPRKIFLESVKFTAPYTVGLSGGRDDRYEQFMARMTMTGGM